MAFSYSEAKPPNLTDVASVAPGNNSRPSPLYPVGVICSSPGTAWWANSSMPSGTGVASTVMGNFLLEKSISTIWP